jgi:hypothetical protein
MSGEQKGTTGMLAVLLGHMLAVLLENVPNIRDPHGGVSTAEFATSDGDRYRVTVEWLGDAEAREAP